MEENEKIDPVGDQQRQIIPKASPARTRIIILSLGVVFILVSLILLLRENSKTHDTRSRAEEPEASASAVFGEPVTDEQSNDVKMISPRDNDVLMDPIKVEADLGPLSATTVEFWMDNDKVPFYTATEAPYEIVVPDLQPGKHTFYVKVMNSDGNVKTSHEVSARITPNSASLIKDKGEKE
jgi:hypothetical protein